MTDLEDEDAQLRKTPEGRKKLIEYYSDTVTRPYRVCPKCGYKFAEV